jgi:hypothetical protein
MKHDVTASIQKFKTTYSEFSFSPLFTSQKVLQLAKLLANVGCIISVLESWHLLGPLGALFGFHKEVDKLFSCRIYTIKNCQFPIISNHLEDKRT